LESLDDVIPVPAEEPEEGQSIERKSLDGAIENKNSKMSTA